MINEFNINYLKDLCNSNDAVLLYGLNTDTYYQISSKVFNKAVSGIEMHNYNGYMRVIKNKIDGNGTFMESGRDSLKNKDFPHNKYTKMHHYVSVDCKPWIIANIPIEETVIITREKFQSIEVWDLFLGEEKFLKL